MKIGFLGSGRIAKPLVLSLARRFPRAQICVSQRSAAVSARLATEFDNVQVAENQPMLAQSEVVFLCLRAEQAKAALPLLRFRNDHKLISVMAGLSRADLTMLTLPATEICTIVPLGFIAYGGCPLPVFPENAIVQALFGQENEVLPMPSEDALAAHFAVTAVLSNCMQQLHTASQWLAQTLPDAAQAERYVAHIVSGYLTHLQKDGQARFSEIIEALSSDGGLNQQLLHQMMAAGHFQHLQTGLDALKERLIGGDDDDVSDQ